MAMAGSIPALNFPPAPSTGTLPDAVPMLAAAAVPASAILDNASWGMSAAAKLCHETLPAVAPAFRNLPLFPVPVAGT
ncbi:hypothetical protein D3C76_1406450 [compost metagenome]